jgi:hypothetical protein
MKNLKKIFGTAVIAGSLLFGTTASQAGVVISGLTEESVQKQAVCTTTSGKGIIIPDFGGVVISGLIGVVISGFTGVVISGAAETPTNCGVVISG